MPFIDLKAQQERIRAKLDARIARVIDSCAFTNGPEVRELERQLASYTGAKEALAVSSGTDALLMPLMAWGIGAGDAVFVPSFTFTATAEAVLLLGAAPIFVDVDPQTYNLDPADLSAKIAEVEQEGRLRPAAIMPVDLFGLAADYPAIHAIAAAKGLKVLADAAQSFGAKAGNKRAGNLAPVTATSFYPAKPLGCYGDGGAIFTDDPAYAEILRSIREHGYGQERYDVVRVGINGRLDSIQAAVLIEKLAIFDEELEARERISRAYDAALGDLVTALPARPADFFYAWAQYTIRVPAAVRDGLRAKLQAQGIPTMVYYPRPMHLQPAYIAYGKGPGSLPVSERLPGEVLSLPMHPYLTDGDIDRVTGAVRAELKELGIGA